MIKRTLYFGNPACLSMRNAQLVIHIPDANEMDDKTGNNTIPIEDIGVGSPYENTTIKPALYGEVISHCIQENKALTVYEGLR